MQKEVSGDKNDKSYKKISTNHIIKENKRS